MWTRIGPVYRVDATVMDQNDPLARFRDEFDLAMGGPVYLNGNSLGPPPRAVVQAIHAGVDEWARQLVGGWNHWIDLPVAVGDRVGSLIGAASGQVVVCDNATTNIYKLARAALGHRPERHCIVAGAEDFPTDRYILQGIAAESGHQLRLVPSTPTGGLDLDALQAAVGDDTALVCLSHVDYRSAARLDMAQVTEMVHRRGALILWDLCHSAGAVPVDLDGAGADMAVGCTYKYLNAGPGAPAFLYACRGLQGALAQPIWGWFGQRGQFDMGPAYQRQEGVGRFLTGTPGVLGLVAVDAAARLIEAAGVGRLWDKSQALTEMLVEVILTELEPSGAALASPRDGTQRGAHVSVAHPSAREWCASLIRREMVVGDFRPPDQLRLAPAPLYTRFVDVFDAGRSLIQVLREGFPKARLPDRS